MRSTLLAAALLGALLASGCASYDGRGLVPGQATEADVLAKMGAPSQTIRRPDGSAALYFSRMPYGRQIFMASFGPDRVLKRIEPTLDYEHIRRVKTGVSTVADVKEILGPPASAARAPFKPIDVWEYQWQIGADLRLLWIGFSDDGIVREVTDIHDHGSDEPTGADMPSS